MQNRYTVILVILSLFASMRAASAAYIRLTPAEAEQIGYKIWLNETGGNPAYLIAWNHGESFASLGIGHFIWYPAGQRGPFQESFPELVQFLQNQRVPLPGWLSPMTPCLWAAREEFLQAQNSREMQDLRFLLTQTTAQQVQFMIQRLENSLSMILASLAAEAERYHVYQQFYRMAETLQGIYALTDYVNFKGEGVAATERYQGQGWGLLQVLQSMPGTTPDAVGEFADAAEFMLTRRVQNAPVERQEQEARWLPGWIARINTYRRAL
ncbi:hypothetical protein U27_02345 [Candidatus Vecturithrix granuli]|uniref:Uncharacterized protein n=1 Tax=Vecturithrix granuli TaxID=1499967 RepID=A0A0S6W765_VECG1|nr:hypothetical protein U27_02345 [Candidatus Vecturithrix granuli]